jgi:thymidylate synthase (FAD)
MILIEQSYKIIQSPAFPSQMIERCGRTCYKSEDKITDDSAKKFISMIMKRGHESVIEHVSASVKFITNRGVTHELVRHRLCSFSQESTRYVNYSGHGMEFIVPVWTNLKQSGWDTPVEVNDSFYEYGLSERVFLKSCDESEHAYNNLIQKGWRPEQAREVLPNALKTEIVVTANFREWRHIFKLRTSPAAHPQIRALMRECLNGFICLWPEFFGDLKEEVP